MVKMMQKAKNAVKLLVILIIVGCSSVIKDVKKTNDLQKIMYLITNKDVFYKSVIKDKKKPIYLFVQPNLLEFNLCDTNGLGEIQLSNNEVEFIRDEYRIQRKVRLDKILNKNNYLSTNKLGNETKFITVPVIFRNNTMAIYYSYSKYGGGFNLLQKKDSNWQVVCSNAVYLE